MIIGYIRTSTRDQKASLAEQERKLKQAGAERVYIEERSGGSIVKRQELQKLLSTLRSGDQVISTKLDRLSRSLSDFLKIHEEIESRGASLSFTDQQIETDTPAGRLMLNMLGAFAEFERGMIRERVQSGVDRARREGKQLGRPRVDLSKHDKAQALATLVEQGSSITHAARTLGVSRMTAHRWLKAVA